jgi:hypothetical protein
MPKKVPNIQRIINDILKIINIVFSPPPPPPPAVYGPAVTDRLHLQFLLRFSTSDECERVMT